MSKITPFDPQELERMNNFFCHFGWGADSSHPEGPVRTSMKERGWWNLTYLEITRCESNSGYDTYWESWRNKRSEMFLNQSPSQFYTVVDDVVLLLGLSPAGIARLVKEYHQALRTTDMEDARIKRKVLNEYLAPIYQELRQRGYNVSELRD